MTLTLCGISAVLSYQLASFIDEVRVRQAIVLLLAFVCHSVFSGELVTSDISSARKALAKLLHDEANQYQFENKLSGCAFESCSTNYVRFNRHAAFSVITSPTGAPVQRRKLIRCFIATYDHDWKCEPHGVILATVVNSAEGAFEVSAEIDDDLAIDLVKYIRSECFAKQLGTYNESGAKVPQWARNDFAISGIWASGGHYHVSVPFSRPVGDGVYILEPRDGTFPCNFSLVRFWLRHY